jgi:hypothetical protein
VSAAADHRPHSSEWSEDRVGRLERESPPGIASEDLDAGQREAVTHVVGAPRQQAERGRESRCANCGAGARVMHSMRISEEARRSQAEGLEILARTVRFSTQDLIVQGFQGAVRTRMAADLDAMPAEFDQSCGVEEAELARADCLIPLVRP